MQAATLLVDAMLGTGLEGPAREPVLSFIREWNDGFPLARRIAVDVPSGLGSDGLSREASFAAWMGASRSRRLARAMCCRHSAMPAAR